MGDITIVHAALDELQDGSYVLRGVISPESFHELQVADYQREILPLASINRLVRAFEEGKVPDIELGMRGEDFRDADRDAVILLDPVYIIDGLQRVSAARRKIEISSGNPPHLGAVIHFNTDEQWERERFRVLNMDRTKLSPNVLLRNWRHDHEVMEMLYQLSRTDRSFPLVERVCWSQRMRRGELINATTFVKAIGRLHGHMGTSMGSSQIGQLTPALQRVYAEIGRNVFRANVKTFYDVIDTAWGIKRVTYKEGAIYLKATFLMSLARLFSEHEVFWRGNRLVVEAPLIRKISRFPIHDPQVANLATAAGTAGNMLYHLLIEHVNSGKRTKRLQSRYGTVIDNIDPTQNDDEKSAAAAD